ncbi:MAG: radical SAM protein [Candidatus Omnitrophica bacterium]|nr:radical SAM protein [Candidatus Omnitrophota bacterium]
MKIQNPKTCLLTVTNSCILRCKMCNLWQLNTQENEISVDDCKRFVDSLEQFRQEQFEIHIIGGESLIKKDICELVKHISRKGWRSVITSCGYTIDEPMAHALVESGLSLLNLSLDSLVPEVHNYLRGRQDSFQRLMRAIEYLSKFKGERLKLGINTVISAYNLDGLSALTEWVIGNHKLDYIYFMALMRPFGAEVDWEWFKKKEYESLWPSDADKLDRGIDSLIRLKSKSSKLQNSVKQLEDFKSYFRNPAGFIKTNKCNLAYQAINVNAVGDIYLCFFLDKLGNVRDGDITRLWSSARAGSIREKMLRCKNNCELVVNCYYGE